MSLIGGGVVARRVLVSGAIRLSGLDRGGVSRIRVSRVAILIYVLGPVWSDTVIGRCQRPGDRRASRDAVVH